MSIGFTDEVPEGIGIVFNEEKMGVIFPIPRLARAGVDLPIPGGDNLLTQLELEFGRLAITRDQVLPAAAFSEDSFPAGGGEDPDLPPPDLDPREGVETGYEPESFQDLVDDLLTDFTGDPAFIPTLNETILSVVESDITSLGDLYDAVDGVIEAETLPSARNAIEFGKLVDNAIESFLTNITPGRFRGLEEYVGSLQTLLSGQLGTGKTLTEVINDTVSVSVPDNLTTAQEVETLIQETAVTSIPDDLQTAQQVSETVSRTVNQVVPSGFQEDPQTFVGEQALSFVEGSVSEPLASRVQSIIEGFFQVLLSEETKELLRESAE